MLLQSYSERDSFAYDLSKLKAEILSLCNLIDAIESELADWVLERRLSLAKVQARG